MKKLIYLLTLVAFMGISANTFAQGTGIAPEIGSTHNYKITNTDGTFQWFVTENATETFANNIIGNGVVTGSSTANNIDLTWVNPVSETTYFVHVIHDVDGCKNHKVIAVTPINSFNMQVIAIAEAAPTVALATDYSVCMGDVTVSGYNGSSPAANLADAQDFTYDYKTTTFYYKITASGIGTNGWNPEFDINGANAVATYGTTIAGATNALAATDGTLNKNLPFAYNDVVYVKVVVTGTDGSAANPVVLTLSNTSTDSKSNLVKTISEASTQEVKARPATSVITF